MDTIEDRLVFKRYPKEAEVTSSQDPGKKADLKNPAIRLYGRRFYKDQTPVEYLSEFLMVFASPKTEDGEGVFQFNLYLDQVSEPCYWPENRIALKLFTFFPTSKLETRHQIHRSEYLNAIDILKSKIIGSQEQKDEAVRLIQSLFSGFVGVAKDRTWVTCTFLPAAAGLLSREVTWQHPYAIKEKHGPITDWDTASKYFDSNTRNFLGRGGELLYLQLASLFSRPISPSLGRVLERDEYEHLAEITLQDRRKRLESALKFILEDAVAQLDQLSSFIETTLDHYETDKIKKPSYLAWVPVATETEAFLFASEMLNICESRLSSLEKLDLIRTLCLIQVMRSLCFQARRIDKIASNTVGFVGHYAWIVADPELAPGEPGRRLAEESYSEIEAILFRALRSPLLYVNGKPLKERDLSNGDDNCFRMFRKFGKEIGMVIPRNGRGQRFVLNAQLVRLLVASLLRPGERVRLSDFYQRAFSHFGLALGGEPMVIAREWSAHGAQSDEKHYSADISTDWIEETLQQGGFLIELSDAVSIVHNPDGNSGGG
ncbi:hypothetical protein [Thiocapsa imhoffii]|uniref:hypothetical protein n=1 Tax=Thiocapsa imhoffii TaxID=382777 RepID=UPI0019054838|nr:hypothetical protein [Thiocapsa imhoffii]